MKKDFDKAYNSVCKVKSGGLLDFVYQWVTTKVSKKYECAKKIKQVSGYHQKRKAFKLLTFFMNEEDLQEPSDPTAYHAWEDKFLDAARNSIKTTTQIMIDNNLVSVDKRTNTYKVMLSHVVKKNKLLVELLNSSIEKP